MSQTSNALSLPPLASSRSSGLALSPQTSDLCPDSLAASGSGQRTSLWATERSLEPVESVAEPQERELTRALCPA